MGQNAQKPRNVLRHLDMPRLSSVEAKDLRKPPLARPVEVLEATNGSGSSKEENEENKKKLEEINFMLSSQTFAKGFSRQIKNLDILPSRSN